jgi:hypothetical protein
MRKPRSDAKLLNLPEEQQSQLSHWLLSGMPYHQVRALLSKEMGVTTSCAALSAYYSDVCSAALLSKRVRAVSTADQLAEAAAATPGRFDQATIDALKQKAFELSISPQADPRDVKSLMMLVLKSRDQDLSERRIQLLEAKANQADQAEAVVKSALSPDEKTARFKEIFGIQ